MRRTQRLLALALVLALLAPCFGVALAADGDDKKTPKPAKDEYTINGITYFKVDSDNFKDHPKQFLADMVNGISNDWLGTALGCLFTVDPILTHVVSSEYEAKDSYMRTLWSKLDPKVKDRGLDYIDVVRSDAVYGTSINQAIDKLKANINSKKPQRMETPADGKFLYGSDETRNKKQDVVAVACYMQDKTGPEAMAKYHPGYYAGAVLYFTDFQVVALLPDASDPGNYVYTRYTETPGPDQVYASNVKNLTLVPVTAVQTVSSGWSETATSTVGGSESYSLAMSLTVGTSFSFLGTGVSASATISASDTFTESWSKSESQSKSGSVTDSVSVALPPYTNVVMDQGSSTTEAETAFNCPIGLKFTVRAVGFSSASPTNHNWTFGPDARADLYKRAIQNGSLDIEESSSDSEAIHWQAVDDVYLDVEIYYEEYYRLTPKNNYTYCSNHVPMAPQGAVFNETLSTHSTNVKTIAPILPLRIVKLQPPNISFISGEQLSYGKFNYVHADMNVGDSSYTYLLTLSGLNAYGADYYGFNPRNGTWKVVDKDGKELKDEDAPVRLEKLNDVSRTIRYVAQKPGTCFLKYEISEKAYPEDGIAYAEDPEEYDKGNTSYTKNEQLASTAALEITVAENHTIEVTGSYTGEVHKAAEKLEENGLSVSFRRADGKELDEKYTWEAQELPAKGISLSADGAVKFDKPGTFHVRAVCQAHNIASDWVEITAAEKGLARIVTPPTPRDGLYDGQEQALLVPGEVEGGTMVYCLDTENSGDTFTEVGKVFSADVPTASQAGTYKIWYKALGDANHIDSQVSYVIVTVLKSPVQPVKPGSEALVYNGEAQALVQAGNVAGGTLQYFVGDKAPEKDGDWSAEMPTGTDAGEYTVWYRVKGDKNHNDSEPASLKVTIEKRPLLVTPNDAAKTFGDADPVLTWTADGLVGSDSLLGKLVRTKGENVGTYAIARGSLAATDNYALVVNEGLFTIKPKKITVKAKDATAVYGNADPELEYTVTGLLGKDQLTGRLSRKDGVDVGKYPITQGTLAAPGNYTLTFKGAVFTVTKRQIVVKAKTASKRYGDADPELEYTVEGLMEPGQLTGKLVRKAGEKVGAYSIGRGTLAVGKNYKMTFTGAKFTITPRTVTVTANNVSKTVGSADPELTYSASGLINGARLRGRLNREAGEAPGSYAITQGTLRAPKNYVISFKEAKLTITAREPLPVASDFTLLAQMKPDGDEAIYFSWSKVKGAVGYDVFFKSCNGDQDYALYKAVMGLNCRIKDLKKGLSYKGYVRAWTNKNGGKAYIGDASPVTHCIVGGYSGNLTNAESVSLNKSKLTLVKGKTSVLKARAKGEKSGKQLLAHVEPIRYYSSDANVAKVNRDGRITAVNGGVCRIYAIANDGVYASARVRVIAQPRKLSFAKGSYTVKQGKTLKLAKQVEVKPAGLKCFLAWTSSNPDIATVSANGVVKGVKKGSTTITVAAENGRKASVTVKVR